MSLQGRNYSEEAVMQALATYLEIVESGGDGEAFLRGQAEMESELRVLARVDAGLHVEVPETMFAGREASRRKFQAAIRDDDTTARALAWFKPRLFGIIGALGLGAGLTGAFASGALPSEPITNIIGSLPVVGSSSSPPSGPHLQELVNPAGGAELEPLQRQAVPVNHPEDSTEGGKPIDGTPSSNGTGAPGEGVGNSSLQVEEPGKNEGVGPEERSGEPQQRTAPNNDTPGFDVNSASSGTPPGHGGVNPGQGVGPDGTPPGQGGENPGQGVGPDGTPPGQGGENPGQGVGPDGTPPGQGGENPGQGVGPDGTPPGQSGGNNSQGVGPDGTPPGQSGGNNSQGVGPDGTPPGQSGGNNSQGVGPDGTPPGQSGGNNGQGVGPDGTPPGQQDDGTPGNSGKGGTAPGQNGGNNSQGVGPDGTPPGHGGENPGKSGGNGNGSKDTPPGQEDDGTPGNSNGNGNGKGNGKNN